MTSPSAVYHYRFSTPFGSAAVIYRKPPFSIVQVLLPRRDSADLVADAGRAGWGVRGDDRRAVSLADRISRYFKGGLLSVTAADWKALDMSGLSALQQAVLAATARIPYAELSTYRRLAETVGRPKAYRFVGGTMAANPFPVLIPCHRVIRSDGSLGGFGGGLDLKRRMLDLEAAHRPKSP